MRACFLGQNVCALGFGVATLQTPPLMPDEATPDVPAAIIPPVIIPDVTSIRPPDDISAGFGAAAPPQAGGVAPLPPAPLA